METYQVSEQYKTGIMLAIVGGFLDAYTFICRGEVFANAQTGNMVLFGIYLAGHNWKRAVYYLAPITAAILGTVTAALIRSVDKKFSKLHWRQIVIAIEMIVLLIMGFVPQGNLNSLVNISISFVCALQVQSFRKIQGRVFVTTMCTGNLRSGTEQIVQYFSTKDKKALHYGSMYFGIIFLFIGGAILGAVCTKAFMVRAVYIPVVILFFIFLYMFQEKTS